MKTVGLFFNKYDTHHLFKFWWFEGKFIYLVHAYNSNKSKVVHFYNMISVSRFYGGIKIINIYEVKESSVISKLKTNLPLVPIIKMCTF